MSLRQVVTIDANGLFFFEVPANDRIFPSGTYYKIQYLDRQFFKVVQHAHGRQLLALPRTSRRSSSGRASARELAGQTVKPVGASALHDLDLSLREAFEIDPGDGEQDHAVRRRAGRGARHDG